MGIVMRLYLQDIIDDISFEQLPAKWQVFDFARFSKDKTLFDFQKQALQNALKGLWLYYQTNTSSFQNDNLKEANKLKQDFFRLYSDNGFNDNFDYDLKKKAEGKTIKYLLEYDQDYPAINSKISFAHFINRMSFWMATGSGKTLIIVKLIELLGKLIFEKELPEGDILFLTHRDDLLDQFKNHIDEFNSFNLDTHIVLKNLKEYDRVKLEYTIPFTKNEITVFYYRSDLISDEQKEKIVDFRNYDNNGKWYVLLDEAHKGDKEDSKRQIFYSILSRNRFLFNFSATFTDPRDFVTCAYNFNLSKYVEDGYGKHIYVSSADIDAFHKKNDFSHLEKQKIVLKSLLLLTYIIKNYKEIRKVDKSLYHKPLLLTLVNSVNVEEADLELFFEELERIAKNEVRVDLFEEAKQELVKEFDQNPKYEFEELNCIVDTAKISQLDYKDILRNVYNAKTPGNIEVLKIPGNKQELIFRLMTAEKPFALIKIGDISDWLKDKLEGYEINESFENESYFRQINRDDSDINILMGSRSFYEGWDSNRPNLILFVNIGIGNNAKKFVLQSVGRGVRIEPQKNKRKRLQNLYNAKEVTEELYNKVKNLVQPLESLFIFGTNAENLKEIIATLKAEKQDIILGEAFILNPEVQNRLLLIPVYKTTEMIFAEDKTPQKYPISTDDFNITSQYYDFIGDKIALTKYDCEAKILQKAKDSFQEKDKYYDFSEKTSLFEPELILGRIFDYLGVKSREFDKFKDLEDEIVHFKKIRFSHSKNQDKILENIEKVKNYYKRASKEQEIDAEFDKTKDTKKFKQSYQQLELDFVKEIDYDGLKIKYIQNHYYLPVILSETEKIEYINHIINVKSEVDFINELEQYLDKSNNIFKQFDWWMFSKLDQTLDEVFIPYYNAKGNNIANFKPDFIFWLQKGNRYQIVFIDPKGTEYTDAYRKIDGYSRIFESGDIKQSKDFSYNGYTVNTLLLLKPKRGIAEVPENYRKYWFDNFDDLARKITIP